MTMQGMLIIMSAGTNTMHASMQNKYNSQLLAGVDESDLLDLDTLLLLEGLLDGEDLVLGLKVEGLLAAGEGLDENLQGVVVMGQHRGARWRVRGR